MHAADPGGHNLRNCRAMGWFRVTRGRLEYAGRITRAPFSRWTATKEGADGVTRVAEGIRFRVFRRWRAKRRMWRALEAATRTQSLSAAIAAEGARYMQVAANLSYADALPRAHIALHRLVLVPRAMVTGRAQSGLFERLRTAPALATVDESVRVFLLTQLIIEMDTALQSASPTPRRPVQAHEEWACVGITKGITWADPIWAGPDGTGHVFMYEFPRAGLPRRSMKALEAAIAEMSAAVSALSRADRVALVRAASVR
jgi:hypothetical protein